MFKSIKTSERRIEKIYQVLVFVVQDEESSELSILMRLSLLTHLRSYNSCFRSTWNDFHLSRSLFEVEAGGERILRWSANHFQGYSDWSYAHNSG